MEKIKEELEKIINLNNDKNDFSKLKQNIKMKETELDKLNANLQLQMSGTPLKSIAQEKLDIAKKEFEKMQEDKNKKQKELNEKFEAQKENLVLEIEKELKKYIRKSEIDNLKSSKKAYENIANNAEKTVKRIIKDFNDGKNIDQSMLNSAKEEMKVNREKAEEVNKEIENYVEIDSNIEKYSDLEYLKTRMQALTLEELDEKTEEKFCKKYFEPIKEEVLKTDLTDTEKTENDKVDKIDLKDIDFDLHKDEILEHETEVVPKETKLEPKTNELSNKSEENKPTEVIIPKEAKKEKSLEQKINELPEENEEDKLIKEQFQKTKEQQEKQILEAEENKSKNVNEIVINAEKSKMYYKNSKEQEKAEEKDIKFGYGLHGENIIRDSLSKIYEGKNFEFRRDKEAKEYIYDEEAQKIFERFEYADPNIVSLLNKEQLEAYGEAFNGKNIDKFKESINITYNIKGLSKSEMSDKSKADLEKIAFEHRKIAKIEKSIFQTIKFAFWNLKEKIVNFNKKGKIEMLDSGITNGPVRDEGISDETKEKIQQMMEDKNKKENNINFKDKYVLSPEEKSEMNERMENFRKKAEEENEKAFQDLPEEKNGTNELRKPDENDLQK